MPGGDFLWTVLVRPRLREVITVSEVHEALREFPLGMSEIYELSIGKMKSSRSKDRAKHIKRWDILSARSITVGQMPDAVKLSLGTVLAGYLRVSLHSLCGLFLDRNKQSESRVRIIHNTVRAFLTT